MNPFSLETFLSFFEWQISHWLLPCHRVEKDQNRINRLEGFLPHIQSGLHKSTRGPVLRSQPDYVQKTRQVLLFAVQQRLRDFVKLVYLPTSKFDCSVFPKRGINSSQDFFSGHQACEKP